jgi:hypothetical protein
LERPRSRGTVTICLRERPWRIRLLLEEDSDGKASVCVPGLRTLAREFDVCLRPLRHPDDSRTLSTELDKELLLDIQSLKYPDC